VRKRRKKFIYSIPVMAEKAGERREKRHELLQILRRHSDLGRENTGIGRRGKKQSVPSSFSSGNERGGRGMSIRHHIQRKGSSNRQGGKKKGATSNPSYFGRDTGIWEEKEGSYHGRLCGPLGKKRKKILGKEKNEEA